MSSWIVLTYLETIPERLAPDEMLAAVPAKIWRHHFVQAVFSIHPEPLGGGFVEDIKDGLNL
jgi:hypothetical protein